MTINYVNTGTSPNKGNGDTLRTAFNKINANFSYLANTAALGGPKGDTGTQGIEGPVGPVGPVGLGNTGLITFADTSIIGAVGADPAYPYGNIQLIPNPNYYNVDDLLAGGFLTYGQFLNIYPATNATLDTPHIHIAAGTGYDSTGDLVLGTDQQNVMVNHLGNIAVTSKNATTNIQYTWNFDIDGRLVLPAGGSIVDSTGTDILSGYVLAPTPAATTSTLVNGTYTVALNSIGELVFPDGTVQTTASTGTQTVNLAVLKAIVAASVTFADFQTLVANL